MEDRITFEHLSSSKQEFMGRYLSIAPRRQLAKLYGCSPTAAWNSIQRLRRSRHIKTAYYSNGKTSLYEV